MAIKLSQIQNTKFISPVDLNLPNYNSIGLRMEEKLLKSRWYKELSIKYPHAQIWANTFYDGPYLNNTFFVHLDKYKPDYRFKIASYGRYDSRMQRARSAVRICQQIENLTLEGIERDYANHKAQMAGRKLNTKG